MGIINLVTPSEVFRDVQSVILNLTLLFPITDCSFALSVIKHIKVNTKVPFSFPYCALSFQEPPAPASWPLTGFQSAGCWLCFGSLIRELIPSLGWQT